MLQLSSAAIISLDKKKPRQGSQGVPSRLQQYFRERTQILDWIERNKEMVAQANQNFTNTDYALKLYNQLHS